jgi:hypothetical protein
MLFIRTSPFALRHLVLESANRLRRLINPDPNLGLVVIHGENFAGVLLLWPPGTFYVELIAGACKQHIHNPTGTLRSLLASCPR